MNNNTLIGTLKAKSDVIFISIPYEKGQKAQVNGKHLETFELNHGFIGLQVKEGTNDIKLVFEQALYKEGILVFLLSVIIALTILVYLKGKEKIKNEY